MLTGDKGKTARMIGIQCGMLTPQQKQIKIEENKHEVIESPDAIEKQDVKKPMNKISSVIEAKEEVILYEVDEDTQKNPQEEIKKIMQLAQSRKQGTKMELLIDGCAFARMLDCSKETLIDLNIALNQAQAVIIYRASPKQKEQVVQFMRSHNPGKVTLSIGDGSNDVNMI